jgi:phosphoribosylaminoimidazole-succinocarboxamide synthase
MTDEYVNSVSERYIELYEKVVGKKFERADINEVEKRVEANINSFLSTNS